MLDFFFLSEEQLFGTDKLDFFYKSSELVRAPITDYAILLGGSSHSFVKGLARKINPNQVPNGLFGLYWTSTYQGDCYIATVNAFGMLDSLHCYDRISGARPAIKYSQIKNLVKSKNITSDGILEVEFGEYPQYVVDDERLEGELEKINKIRKENSLSLI